MNAMLLKKELENQIQLYKNFIPYMENNKSMFKLMREIYRLTTLVDNIKSMNFDQLTKEFELEIIQRSSIINYPKNDV